MYIKTDMEIVGALRSPIQCEGIDRGPKRIAEVAASGSVGPQGFWDTLSHVASAVAPAIPGILGAI
jgi:hypothetical protein